MHKFLIYIVAAAIVAVLGADIYLVVAGKATPTAIVEIAVGSLAILAWAAVAFAKTVGGFSWPSFRRDEPEDDPLADKVDGLDSDLGTLSGKVDDIDSKVDDINATLDSRLGPEPSGFVPTINSTDENGKLVKVYDLPVQDTYEDAVQAAKDSIQAREDEGNPVNEPKITVVPAFDP